VAILLPRYLARGSAVSCRWLRKGPYERAALVAVPIARVHVRSALCDLGLRSVGYKQAFCAAEAMSALPAKADMCGTTRDVRFGPEADMERFRTAGLILQP
jgi:hypothetical protein